MRWRTTDGRYRIEIRSVRRLPSSPARDEILVRTLPGLWVVGRYATLEEMYADLGINPADIEREPEE